MAPLRQQMLIEADFKDNASSGMAGLRKEAGKTFDDKQDGSVGFMANRTKAALLGAAAAVGTTMFLAFKKATGTAKDFNAQMDRVSALSGASKEELRKLNEQARELGGLTVFSSTEVAEGMQALAMAGFKTNQILDAMPGLLDAAASGQEDLGETADAITDIMGGFNIPAKETGRLADIMAKTFTSSNTTLLSLKETMKFVAPIAASAGAEIEVVAAAAGILGSNGLKGSIAGTSLRGMFLKLQTPGEEAAEMMSDLNIQLIGSNDKLKPLPDLIRGLRRGLGGLKPTAQIAFLKDLVGTEGLTGLQILLDAGPEKLELFADKLRNSAGEAARIAAIQTDNLVGKEKQLNSALESLEITIGTLLTPAMESLTDGAASVVKGFDSVLQRLSNPGWRPTGAAGTAARSIEDIGTESDNTTGFIGAMTDALTTQQSVFVPSGRKFDSYFEMLQTTEDEAKEAKVEIEKLSDAFGDLAEGLPGTQEEVKNLAIKIISVSEGMDLTRKELIGADTDFDTLKESIEAFNDPLITLVDEIAQLDEELKEIDLEGLEPPPVSAFKQIERGIREEFGPGGGIEKSMVSGLQDMIAGESFKAGMLSVAEGIGGVVGGVIGTAFGGQTGGQIGATLGAQIGRGIKKVTDILGGLSKSESREKAVKNIEDAIRKGDIGEFTSIKKLTRSLDGPESARATLEAIQATFGISQEDAGDLIRFLTSDLFAQVNPPGFAKERLEARFNQLLGADEQRAVLAFAETLIPAAGGFHGEVDSPTLFMAGEAGPERVDISPQGGFQGSAGNNVFVTVHLGILEQGVKSAVETQLGPLLKRYIIDESERGDMVASSTGITEELAA